MYVSEWNPLDSYRRFSELKRRYDEATADCYDPEIIISPLGSKVMSIGALMAAVKHGLTVKYVETVRYELTDSASDDEATIHKAGEISHVWLQGPIYAGYGKGASN
jgi:hypothetical protein